MAVSSGLPAAPSIASKVTAAFTGLRCWAEHNDFDLSGLAEPIEAVLLDDLSRTPQLAEAPRSGMVGIARWIDHRAPWVVVAPDDDEPVGRIDPPDINTGCFLFTGEDRTLYVVARSLERAIAARDLPKRLLRLRAIRRSDKRRPHVLRGSILGPYQRGIQRCREQLWRLRAETIQ